MGSFKLVAALETRIDKVLREQLRNDARAVTGAILEAGTWAKDELRRMTRAANFRRGVTFAGANLEKPWRMEAFPAGKGISLNKAIWIFSKSRRVHSAFATGGTIRAKSAKWLVIPLPAAEKLKLARSFRRSRGSRPRRYSMVKAAIDRFGALRFVKISGSRALLVADQTTRTGRRKKTRAARGKRGAFSPTNFAGATSLPLFLLVRSVSLPRKFDIDSVVRKMDRRAVSALQRRLGG